MIVCFDKKSYWKYANVLLRQKVQMQQLHMYVIYNGYQCLTGLNFYTICLTINSSLHTMDGQNKHPIIWLDRYAELYSGWDM